MKEYNNSFVFYGSFYDAVQNLSKKIRLNFLDKLLSYMTYGEEHPFSEKEKIEQAMFLLVKPQIDKNIEKRNKGEAGGRPEITQEIKEAIIIDLQEGMTQKEIAEKYEIAQSTVAGIKKRWVDAQNYQKPDYHGDYHDNAEVYDNPQYHKPNANVNDNIPPEISGGESLEPHTGEKTESGGKAAVPDEAIRLASLLAELHKTSDPHFSPPEKHILKWASDIDKLNRIDGRSYADIEAVIRFVKIDGNFWNANIISGKKLREKFSTVFVQMQQNFKKQNPPFTQESDAEPVFSYDDIPEHLRPKEISDAEAEAILKSIMC